VARCSVVPVLGGPVGLGVGASLSLAGRLAEAAAAGAVGLLLHVGMHHLGVGLVGLVGLVGSHDGEEGCPIGTGRGPVGLHGAARPGLGDGGHG